MESPRSASIISLAVFTLVGAGSSHAQVNVTDYHYDKARTGQNLNETILTPANVNPATFGKRFSCPVDGFVYAQPLYLSNVRVLDGSVHNIVYVATQHDSVYAYDAVNPGCLLLWKRSFIDPAQGITTVPSGDVATADIVPEVGIVPTPVIDAASGLIYVLAKTKEVRGTDNHYVQRLHALSVSTGDDLIAPNGQLVADTIFGSGAFFHDPANPCVPGTGDGSQLGQVCFNSLRQMVRPGLALMNGVLFLASGSHGDNRPYHGWVLGYDAATLQFVTAFNTTPNGGLGGIWEGGDGPAFDNDGNLYVATGNGTFRQDVDPNGSVTMNLGDSIIKLSATPRLSLVDFFTPFDQADLDAADADQGSGGITLLPDAGGTLRWLVQAGKRGKIYLLDTSNLGQFRNGPCDGEDETLRRGGAVYAERHHRLIVWHPGLF